MNLENGRRHDRASVPVTETADYLIVHEHEWAAITELELTASARNEGSSMDQIRRKERSGVAQLHEPSTAGARSFARWPER